MKLSVYEDDGKYKGMIDATELLSAMGVEVCATPMSDLSVENEQLKLRSERYEGEIQYLRIRKNEIDDAWHKLGDTCNELRQQIEGLMATNRNLARERDAISRYNDELLADIDDMRNCLGTIIMNANVGLETLGEKDD